MPAIRMFDLGCIDNSVMRANEGEEKGEEDGETDGGTEGKPDSVDLELWQRTSTVSTVITHNQQPFKEQQIMIQRTAD